MNLVRKRNSILCLNKSELSLKLVCVALLCFVFASCTSTPAVQNLNKDHSAFNVGREIFEFEYDNRSPEKENITVAVWYPTNSRSKSRGYRSGILKYRGKIAKYGEIIKSDKPYPMVVFSHGAYGSGYDAAYLMEYFASQGFIAVAQDYTDKMPPGYRDQIAYGRIEGGKATKNIRLLKKILDTFVKKAHDTPFYIAYLNTYRFNQTSFVIDKMIELNRDSSSKFFNQIDENAIGGCGHSEGGLTMLAKVGAHPEPDRNFKDSRIKAVLLLASAIYPFKDTIKNVDVPLMLMLGDHDRTPALHPEVARREIYDRANPPKYLYVLKNTKHITFINILGNRLRFSQGSRQTAAIRYYGTAFLKRYLNNDPYYDEILKKSDDALPYVAIEYNADDSFESGIEKYIEKE